MTMQTLLKIIGAVVGTYGFGILFKLKPKLLLFATLDALVTTVVYFVFYSLLDGNDFVCNMIAAFFTSVLAEIFARVCKAPATVFLLPGCIPLVPGGTLYYTMYNLMISNTEKMLSNLLTAVTVGVGIGTGIIVASFCKYALDSLIKTTKEKKSVRKNVVE